MTGKSMLFSLSFIVSSDKNSLEFGNKINIGLFYQKINILSCPDDKQ
jgi:hypothetical protein